MKYYNHRPALCLSLFCLSLLLLLAAAPARSQAAGPGVDLRVPSTFPLSDAATAVDDASQEVSLAGGQVEIVHGGDTLYLRVLATGGNGSQLTSIADPDAGIVFRNNTMLLPLKADGRASAGLVVTTDGLAHDTGGYSGTVTGLELDLPPLAVANNTGLEGRATLLLNDLPPGATYHVSFADNDTVREALAASLAGAGQAVDRMTPVLEVRGDTPESQSDVGYVMVTFEASGEEGQAYGGDNVSFYSYGGGQLIKLAASAQKGEGGRTAFQAAATGPGQFAMARAKPAAATPAPGPKAGAKMADLLAFGVVFGLLLIALAAVVRRATRR